MARGTRITDDTLITAGFALARRRDRFAQHAEQGWAHVNVARFDRALAELEQAIGYGFQFRTEAVPHHRALVRLEAGRA